MRVSKRRRRAAFTLIELVASAVLTAMMMAGLLNIVWSVVRESRELQVAQANRFPATQLIQQMRIDFQNARGMVVDPAGVTMHGFLSDALTPGRVRYEIRRIKERSVLMRANGTSAQPVWVGSSAILIEPLEFVDAEDGLLADPESGGLPAVPASFRVTLFGNGKQIIWREVIHHHAS